MIFLKSISAENIWNINHQMKSFDTDVLIFEFTNTKTLYWFGTTVLLSKEEPVMSCLSRVIITQEEQDYSV